MQPKTVLTKDEYGALRPDQTVSLRDLYVEKDGKFYLQAEAVDGVVIENTAGLRSALSAERTTNKELEAKLAAFKDLDPSKARDAVSKYDEMKNWSPEQKVKEREEAREKALTEKFENEKKPLLAENQNLTAQLHKHLVESAAVAAITKRKGSVKVLLPHVKERIRVERNPQTGEFTTVVLDERGQHPEVTRLPNSTGNMSIEELVESLKKDSEYARNFEGSGATGSGASGTGNGSPGGSSKQVNPNLPPTEQLKQAHRITSAAGS